MLRDERMGFYKRSSSSSMVIVILGVAMVMGALMVDDTIAQNTEDCASNLVPCANFLNSTKPPESFCQPLIETVQKQRDCLCNLYNNPSLLKSLGINITQALVLPKHCGISNDVSACNNGLTPTPSGTTGTSPSTPKSDSSIIKMTWTGFSSLVLIWGIINYVLSVYLLELPTDS